MLYACKAHIGGRSGPFSYVFMKSLGSQPWSIRGLHWGTMINMAVIAQTYKERNSKSATIKINTKRVKPEVIRNFLCHLSMVASIEHGKNWVLCP